MISEKECQKSKINTERRWFLTWIASYVASWTVSTTVNTLIAPAITFGWFFILSDFIEEDNEWYKKKLMESEKKWVFLRKNEKKFINIWVVHLNSMLDEQINWSILSEAISEADIIALERWESYFGIIEEIWIKMWKMTKDIDPSNWRLSWIVWWAALWLSFINILWMYWIDVVSLKENKEKIRDNRKKYLFHILKTLWIAQLSIFPPSFIWSLLLTDEDEYGGKYDIGHTADARTIFMTLEIMKLQEKYPDKKILSITGDEHAKWINYYLYEAEWQREFKKVIYNLIYGIYKII